MTLHLFVVCYIIGIAITGAISVVMFSTIERGDGEGAAVMLAALFWPATIFILLIPACVESIIEWLRRH